ncbi:MAG: hypothetical protein ACPH3C_08135, partial [Glaciecola sp.]
MATFNVHRDHLNLQKRESSKHKDHSIYDFLVRYSKIDTTVSDIIIFVDSCKVIDTSHMSIEKCNNLANIRIYNNSVVNIFVRPRGIEILDLGASVIFNYVKDLISKPDVPNLQGDVGSSPNNQLKSATNSFRINQAIADIYGKRQVTPDFAAPSYWVYENNVKKIKE